MSVGNVKAITYNFNVVAFYSPHPDKALTGLILQIKRETGASKRYLRIF